MRQIIEVLSRSAKEAQQPPRQDCLWVFKKAANGVQDYFLLTTGLTTPQMSCLNVIASDCPDAALQRLQSWSTREFPGNGPPFDNGH